MLIGPGQITVNVISAICGLVMMIIVAWFRYRQPDVANTVSFKLTFWIGLVDMLWRVEYLLEMSDEIMYPMAGQYNGFLDLLSWAHSFLRIWAAFLTVCIAFDLQLTFIHKKTQINHIQRWYVLASLLAAFALSLVWLIKSHVTFRTDWNAMDVGWPYEEFVLVNTVSVVIWIGLSIFYSLIVVIMVLVRVLKVTREMKQRNISPAIREKERRLVKSVLRVLLYPVVLIITQPSGLAADCLTTDPTTPLAMFTISADGFLQGSIGILNLIVFCFNPALHRALERTSWWPYKSSSGQGDLEDGNKNDLDLQEMTHDPGVTEFEKLGEAREASFLQTHVQQHDNYKLVPDEPRRNV
ncbi:uncharacterized protein VTP21DRAFT_3189 [Calcarisporiella thermophila]|uniref:uncharacterized protein n=1 Tax=Calcarisporiella thermophila TaxID=911321 RepID=UPI003744ACF9